MADQGEEALKGETGERGEGRGSSGTSSKRERTLSSTSAFVVGLDLVIIRRAQMDEDATVSGAGKGENDIVLDPSEEEVCVCVGGEGEVKTNWRAPRIFFFCFGPVVYS